MEGTWERWKNTSLLLTGIGVSNLGAWVYLIALNLIILEMTGSPLAVSVLYILIPLAAMFTNFWAGSLIDRLNQKHMMVSLDVFRAGLIFILPFLDSLLLIYILVFGVNVASAMFEPASVVYMTKLIPKRDRQRFNALRNFINSCGFILGPSVAGALFMMGSPSFAIFMNAVALCISAIIILFLPDLHGQVKVHDSMNMQSVISDWKRILAYGGNHKYITLIYILFGGVTVFMTGLDSLEAAFAMEVLLLDESTYSFLVSIAGAGIVAGSLINALFAKLLKINVLMGLGVILTPAGYLIFAFSTDFRTAAIGFFLLTFALSFANTGFLTFYQNNIPVEIMGRFSAVFGMVEAAFIVLLTLAIGIAAELMDIRLVYIVGSFLFLGLGMGFYFIIQRRNYRKYYQGN
ncbi:MFS transporter [Oceanobacillus sp. CFH 90083]|uniref:MFS transporter n=1 Tax=Oceanobacillus sp. CFH 90083 TaxID=2592336 RepID=UPI00128BF343|nr:MFS transporter [Oceanobacillus sp. CFH 90083]